MSDFTIFPAIDLRNGQVVRLKKGDPNLQTNYSSNPAEIAANWLDAGAKWLHIVNLDGAFGSKDNQNLSALKKIVSTAKQYNASIQFGGGLRNVENIQTAVEIGVDRVIFGTAAVQNPSLMLTALEKYGNERVALSLDAKNGLVQVKGWQESTQLNVIDLAKDFQKKGLKWLVFTDINRDGLQTGVNITSTSELAQKSKLHVIASGGVKDWSDIKQAYQAKLPGIIVGRALYEGNFIPKELFSYP